MKMKCKHPKRTFKNILVYVYMGFPSGSTVKNPPANAGDAGDMGSILESVGRRHDNPLQYSCWENPMDRGACQVTVPGSQRIGQG